MYVLCGHARWLLWSGHSAWRTEAHTRVASVLELLSASLRYGHEAVLVFFVLSGFFIHLREAEQSRRGHSGQFNAVAFYRRRVWRLGPPYLFALALTLLADSFGKLFYFNLYAGTTGDPMLDSNFSNKGYGLTSIISPAVLLPGSLGTGFGSNGPLWSLAFEVVYYFVYPAWILLRRSYGAKIAYSSSI